VYVEVLNRAVANINGSATSYIGNVNVSGFTLSQPTAFVMSATQNPNAVVTFQSGATFSSSGGVNSLNNWSFAQSSVTIFRFPIVAAAAAAPASTLAIASPSPTTQRGSTQSTFASRVNPLTISPIAADYRSDALDLVQSTANPFSATKLIANIEQDAKHKHAGWLSVDSMILAERNGVSALALH
jgi:hypothetical protein